MDREPSSSDPLDPCDIKETAHRQPLSVSSKIRRFVFGSLAFLLILFFWGSSFQIPGSNASANQLSSGSTSTAISMPSTSSASVSKIVSPTPSDSASSSTSPTQIPTLTPTPAPSSTPTPVPEIRVTLIAVGDILMHKAVIDGGLTNPGKADPVYDFSLDFQYVSSIIGQSDLAMANFEGTLSGPPYTGFPSFSAPDAIADALYEAGFRVMGTANNHCIDKGLVGLIRTATVFRDKGFTVIGTRPDTESSMDAVVDLGGIKIGLLNYTYETIGSEKQKTINGIPIPKGADPLIDSINPYREDAYQADLAAILTRAAELRCQGAEAICLSIHWGEEYQTQSVQWQRRMAQDLCNGGIDLIVGHHPHVLEEIDVLTSSTTGKQTLVYYSLSNFLQNMNFGTLGTAGKAQDGAIARVTFLKTASGVTVEKGEYIPTFVVRIPKGSGYQHLIVPVLPALSDPAAYQTTTAEMQASYNRINKILGPCTGSAEIPVSEADK